MAMKAAPQCGGTGLVVGRPMPWPRGPARLFNGLGTPGRALASHSPATEKPGKNSAGFHDNTGTLTVNVFEAL